MNSQFTVFANGCFDVLHAGHFNFLMYCYHLKKRHGGELIVAIDSDGKIKEDKGARRPIFSQYQRQSILEGLKVVEAIGPHGLMEEKKLIDRVIVFETNRQLKGIIKEYAPDYLVKGTGWKNNVVGEEFAKTVAFYPSDKVPISTSMIEEKVLNKLQEAFPGICH